MAESDRSKSAGTNWDGAIESAVMSLLAEVGTADIPGLLHVLKRERLRVGEPDLRRVLGSLEKAGRVAIDLDADHHPVVKLTRPFVGWS